MDAEAWPARAMHCLVPQPAVAAAAAAAALTAARFGASPSEVADAVAAAVHDVWKWSSCPVEECEPDKVEAWFAREPDKAKPGKVEPDEALEVEAQMCVSESGCIVKATCEVRTGGNVVAPFAHDVGLNVETQMGISEIKMDKFGVQDCDLVGATAHRLDISSRFSDAHGSKELWADVLDSPSKGAIEMGGVADDSLHDGGVEYKLTGVDTDQAPYELIASKRECRNVRAIAGVFCKSNGFKPSAKPTFAWEPKFGFDVGDVTAQWGFEEPASDATTVTASASALHGHQSDADGGIPVDLRLAGSLASGVQVTLSRKRTIGVQGSTVSDDFKTIEEVKSDCVDVMTTEEIEDEGSSGESATNDVLFRVGDRIRGRYGNDAQFVATIGEFLEQHGEVRVRCEGRCSDMFLKVQQGDILDGKDEPCTSLA